MHGRKVQWEPKDGYCFLHSIRDVLWNEFGEKYDIQTLKALFISEIWAQKDYYHKYSTYENDNKMIEGVELYIQKGIYGQECVDLVVDAATKIFNVNIGIFQEADSKIHCINYKSKTPTNRDIFLKFDNQHYEAVVKRVGRKRNQEEPTIKDLGQNSDDNETDCSDSSYSATFEEYGDAVRDFQFDLGMEEDETVWKDCTPCEEGAEKAPNKCKEVGKWLPHLNFTQSESDVDDPHFITTRTGTQDASTDCIDLTGSDFSESTTTDTSTSTTLPQYPELKHKPPKYQKNPINKYKMSKIVAKVVDEIPWDIDGDCKYIVNCSPEDWLEQTSNGRWFLLRTSGHTNPHYARKVGHCEGSYVCYNETCSKRLTENVINRIDFKREGEGMFTCGPCRQFAQRVYCGTTKRIKLDKLRREALVEHQGKHTCILRPNKRVKKHIIDEHPLPLSGFNTPLRSKMDMMQLSMDRKDHKKVKEIAKNISADDLRERIRRLRKDVRRPLSAKDELDVYQHILTLKSEFTDEYEDPNLIYKACCSELVPGEPGSFVFKTSNVSLEIAAKMAGAKKAHGEDSHLQEEPAYVDGMHSRVRLYKTLTMWTFHPGMRMAIELAIMEVPRENTYYVTKFFQLFQEAMREYLNDKKYEWKPNSLMMDEVGCNFAAVENVFGKDFCDNFTLSCQWHFKNCAEQQMQLKNVPLDE